MRSVERITAHYVLRLREHARHLWIWLLLDATQITGFASDHTFQSEALPSTAALAFAKLVTRPVDRCPADWPASRPRSSQRSGVWRPRPGRARTRIRPLAASCAGSRLRGLHCQTWAGVGLRCLLERREQTGLVARADRSRAPAPVC